MTFENRIPIQKWFRGQVQEAIDRSVIIGEKITSLGGHPTLMQQKVEEGHNHNVDHILKEPSVRRSGTRPL